MPESPLSRGPVPRRSVLAAAVGLPLLGGCFYDDYFDLKWEEEVQLHDGRIIVVALTHTFHRIKQGLARYDGMIARRDTEMSFDAEPVVGQVRQMFKNFMPMFLDQLDGTWYAVILGTYYHGYRERTGQYWGESELANGQRPLKLVNAKWQPIPLRDLPMKFSIPNFIHLDGGAREWAKFANRRISLQEKAEWRKRFPPTPGISRIVRPQKQS